MSILVCDIGGTNTRLALFDQETGDLSNLQKFRNAEHKNFYQIADKYLGEQKPKLSAVALDLAGPVTPDVGQLTNIDWTIKRVDLAAHTQCDQVLLLNDLVAMGMSLNRLPDDGVDVLRAGSIAQFDNYQSLVINLGTGFNICPVKETPNLEALAVEAGHAKIQIDIMALLETRLPANRLADFDTVEKCFAGRRLSGLHAALWETEPRDAAKIVADANAGDANAIGTLRLFQQMLGFYTGSTALNYLPQRGIYFAGSVARGVLEFEGAKHFLDALDQDRLFKERIDAMPIKIMTLDEAPLLGCAQAAVQAFG